MRKTTILYCGHCQRSTRRPFESISSSRCTGCGIEQKTSRIKVRK